MKFCVTTLLLAPVSIQLRLALAFPFSSYSWSKRTLNTLLPVNVTFESTPQDTVIPSTNLTSINVTFSPWPKTPTSINLPSKNYSLGLVIASPWISRDPIDLVSLMDFIALFGDNLEQKYPPPALAPRKAGSTFIDPKTFTRWTIELQRGLLGQAVPTKIVLECVDLFNYLLKRHGPATIGSVIYKTGTSRFFWSNELLMSIESLGGNSLNVSSPSSDYNFDTS